ncbi:MAG: hypothetical protein ACP5R2_07855 [Anaerolineae bacterium]
MIPRKFIFGGIVLLGLVGVAVLLIGLITLPVRAQSPWSGGWMGQGHMGGWGPWNSYTQAYTGTIPYGFSLMGMMGGGAGCPMMSGSWAGVDPDAKPLTLAQARENVQKFLEGIGNSDLELAEVMEFTGNFYAEVRERSTGIGAFELLVDRYTGQVSPEPGPNMMWNLKYGHMGGWGMMRWRGSSDATMPVTPEQAVEQAQKYLDHLNAGLKAGEVEPFYGYYTLHVERDGKVTGMLSVNGYTGAVWYHHWHGDFIAMEEEMSSSDISGPRLAVDRERIDLGTLPFNKRVTAEFRVQNVGDSDLIILEKPAIELVEGC